MESEVYQGMFQREDTFWWHEGMRAISGTILKAYLPKKSGLRILDAGCATGGMFQMLKPFGDITGIDISPEAVTLAQKRNLATVQIADINKLPFPDNSFDLILCSDVLYHQGIGNLSHAFKEIARVLAPDGHFLVREAAYDWLRSEHDRLVWTKHRFTKTEILAHLTSVGLTPIRSTYINFFLFPLALLVRISEKFKKHPRSDQSFFIVNPLINTLLKSFLLLESRLVRIINFPFGLSIITLAKKNNRS